jgi:hypothetical protein
MLLDHSALEARAETYLMAHGRSAYARVGDEISCAIGSHQWDKAHYLQRLQWRIRKLERLRQISDQVALSRLTTLDMA